MSRYIKMLVEDFHSVTVATIDKEGHPQTRVIDLMLWDENGVYLLTAKGKVFYEQLMEQKYIAISATKDKKAISIRGWVRNIGKENLDEMFERNPYMKSIYPGDTRMALDVFCLYKAEGEYFDISNPSAVFREQIMIGNAEVKAAGYGIEETCNGCGSCVKVCPQKCICITEERAVIDQAHCLHCGNCMEVCPMDAVRKRG